MRWRDIKWELTFIALFLLVLPAGLWFYRDYTLGQRLEAELDALKAAGMPLSLAEAMARQVPDDQNAVLLYEQAFGVELSTGRAISTGCELPSFTTDARDVIDAYIYEDEPAGEVSLREAFDDPKASRAMQLLREASQRPYCVIPLKWPEMGRYHFNSHFREAARALRFRAILAAKSEGPTEALGWHAVLMRISEHVASVPTLINQLVCYAMLEISLGELKRLLSHADVPPVAAREFAEVLGQIDLKTSFTQAWIGERAIYCKLFKDVHETPLSPSELLYADISYELPTPLDALYLSPLGRPLQRVDQLALLDKMQQMIRISRLPSRAARPRLAELEQAFEELHPLQAPLTRQWAYAWGGTWDKRDQAVANIELCRIVLALKVYKYERAEYPDSLQSLQETLEWQIPKDPFSGTTYVYNPKGDGFILYSIGPNMIDDGGLPQRDPKIGQSRGDNYDIVWECVK